LATSADTPRDSGVARDKTQRDVLSGLMRRA
jgi:hypothetical protein